MASQPFELRAVARLLLLTLVLGFFVYLVSAQRPKPDIAALREESLKRSRDRGLERGRRSPSDERDPSFPSGHSRRFQDRSQWDNDDEPASPPAPDVAPDRWPNQADDNDEDEAAEEAPLRKSRPRRMLEEMEEARNRKNQRRRPSNFDPSDDDADGERFRLRRDRRRDELGRRISSLADRWNAYSNRGDDTTNE
jgi:hypothetical protein